MSDDRVKTVGERLRARRRHLELTTEQAANISGVDIGTVSRSENGLTQLTLETAIHLCRALEISLSYLVSGDEGIAAAGTSVADCDLASSSPDLLASDVALLVKLFNMNEDRGRQLIAGWMNEIAGAIRRFRDDESELGAFENYVNLSLTKHPAFRFKVRYPDEQRSWAITKIYELGGELSQGDIPLLLSTITEESAEYQKLDRQNKDLLRRLQSVTPGRVRLLDIQDLQSQLDLDLIGMFDRAEGLNRGKEAISSPESRLDGDAAKLITLFVSICSWFKTLYGHDSHWVDKVRGDIESALASARE